MSRRYIAIVAGLGLRSAHRRVRLERAAARRPVGRQRRDAPQQLLDQRIRRANAQEAAVLGECLEHAWHWMLNVQRILVAALLHMPDDVGYREVATAIINEVGERAYRDAEANGIEITKVLLPQDKLRDQ